MKLRHTKRGEKGNSRMLLTAGSPAHNDKANITW